MHATEDKCKQSTSCVEILNCWPIMECDSHSSSSTFQFRAIHSNPLGLSSDFWKTWLWPTLAMEWPYRAQNCRWAVKASLLIAVVELVMCLTQFCYAHGCMGGTSSLHHILCQLSWLGECCGKPCEVYRHIPVWCLIGWNLTETNHRDDTMSNHCCIYIHGAVL